MRTDLDFERANHCSIGSADQGKGQTRRKRKMMRKTETARKSRKSRGHQTRMRTCEDLLRDQFRGRWEAEGEAPPQRAAHACLCAPMHQLSRRGCNQYGSPYSHQLMGPG